MTSPAPELPDTSDAPPSPEEGTATSAPRRRRFGSGLLAGLVVVVGVALALAAAAYFYRDDPRSAQAGDCVHNSGTEDAPDVTIVDCPAAGPDDLKVLKVVHGVDETQCDTEPGVIATYTEQRRSSTFILCLGTRAPSPAGDLGPTAPGTA
ncbi:hypothetical protein OHV05_01735 [Kitasatospora sp. NBC_00070]|uniref:LppU/SCO3897 family protein n=1 Tax=Kitasatospora sp. NBC_00070 TaxID=2975962 RepID=UPI00324849E6